ncbi:MAG: IS1595 family transposase [Acidimicrobiia bacterium]
MTYTRFMEIFPNHDACLDHLKEIFYRDGTICPGCEKRTKFHRIRGRSAYGCQYCGHQVYPTADTIFNKSTVSLQLWFWAIYLMSSTRCGISAKQLEREIGVTYKTAHRMFKMIRSLLSDDVQTPLNGQVEIDEMYVGGTRKSSKGRLPAPKTTVLGMMERGGRVSAKVVPDASMLSLYPWIGKTVGEGSQVFTDEHTVYMNMPKTRFLHESVNHRSGVFVSGDAHTQCLDGFLALVKNGLRGVYHSVSSEYLQAYLDEYSFRFNRRDGVEPLFWAILSRVQKEAA